RVSFWNLAGKSGQVECLAEPEIEADVTRYPEDIAGSSFARIRIAEALVSLCLVAGKHVGLRDAVFEDRSRTRGNRLKGNRVALDFPVRCPTRVVKHAWSIVEADRHSRVPAEDRRELPVAQNPLSNFVHVGQPVLPFTERQLPHSIYVDLVAHVEVGTGVIV